MASRFWNSSTKDKVRNGTLLGILFGLLLASSVIPWINSIVMFVVNYIPSTYHFPYIEYLVWGILGGFLGYAIDRW